MNGVDCSGHNAIIDGWRCIVVACVAIHSSSGGERPCNRWLVGRCRYGSRAQPVQLIIREVKSLERGTATIGGRGCLPSQLPCYLFKNPPCVIKISVSP